MLKYGDTVSITETGFYENVEGTVIDFTEDSKRGIYRILLAHGQEIFMEGKNLRKI